MALLSGLIECLLALRGTQNDSCSGRRTRDSRRNEFLSVLRVKKIFSSEHGLSVHQGEILKKRNKPVKFANLFSDVSAKALGSNAIKKKSSVVVT